jgi:hypothetical protein
MWSRASAGYYYLNFLFICMVFQNRTLAANAHIIGFPVGLTPGLTRGEIPKMQGVAVKFYL